MSLTIAPVSGKASRARQAPSKLVVQSRYAAGSRSSQNSTSATPITSVNQVSKSVLLAHVARSIQDSLDTEFFDLTPPDIATLRTTFTLLDFLLEDGSATPQLSASPEDGLMIEWLVNGKSLCIECISDSDIRIWADDADGAEVFEIDTNSSWSALDPAIRAAKDYLGDLSAEVRYRAKLRA